MFRDKRTSISIFALLLLVSQGQAQQSDTAVVFTSAKKHLTLPEGTMLTLKTVALEVPAGKKANVVPPGRFLEVTLAEKIGGKRCRAGDPVHFTLVYAVSLEMEGRTVRIPERASIVGHVVFTSPRDAQHSLSRLAVVADSIRWQDDQALLPAIVTSAKQVPRETATSRFRHDDRGPALASDSMSVLARSRRNANPR